MSNIIAITSVITGIHRTKTGSHEDVQLLVVKDDEIPHIDLDAMKVMFPTRVHPSLLEKLHIRKTHSASDTMISW